MTQAKIPNSIEEAVKNLDGIGALLTAKQWERAAIVYAFTEPNGGGPRTGGISRQLSIREFAELGITGLRDRSQIRLYRKAWEVAMQDGAPDAKPGDVVDLPSLPWKEAFGEETPVVQERTARAFIRNNPDAIERIVKENPQLGVEIARQVVATPATRVSVESRMVEHHRERDAVPPIAERPRDYSEDVTRAVNLLVPALRAIERGEWHPATTQEMLLHFLGLLIDRAGTRSGEPVDDLFSEIERYLKEGVA
jgi:hypothetical protein